MDKGDHAKAQQNKRKYGGMKIAFEALTAEMIHDIPVFINDKEEFFAPVFARFTLGMVAFYRRANELYRELLPCFQHLDRLAIHDHQHVITDDEHTVAFEAIDLKTQPDRQELAAERSNYRSVGGVPSTTGYMSHYGHQAPGTNASKALLSFSCVGCSPLVLQPRTRRPRLLSATIQHDISRDCNLLLRVAITRVLRLRATIPIRDSLLRNPPTDTTSLLLKSHVRPMEVLRPKHHNSNSEDPNKTSLKEAPNSSRKVPRRALRRCLPNKVA